ncbi:exosome complex component RRP43-like [Phlebotomus argentipes]|uniref:exosome complex component RRP43-like n=1 Tax=Phlebotomus argentipes TaxID=94469 RepID=UPI0028929F4B|nr:exosome complex component RRP43-like [Phlebotomus argentipes]
MESQSLYKLVHPVKYYRDHLSQNVRPDGRKFLEYRPISVNVDSIGTADGSAIVKYGETTVVCGIKAELAVPRPAEPDSGYLVPNVELTPLCSPKYRPGPPTDEAQVFSKNLMDILVNSKCVDLKDLCVEREKLAWVLYCDVSCFNYDGALLDAATLAVMGALHTCTLPTVVYDRNSKTYKVENENRRKLNVRSLPISTTSMVFDDGTVVTDPTAEEEELASSVATVTSCNSDICFVYKSGGSSVTPKDLDLFIAQAKCQEAKVASLLRSILETSKQEDIVK